MEKINIAELLKDCPKGTKLYTTVWGDVEFIKYNSSLDLITISVHDSLVNEKLLYGDGSFAITGECILFPSKENRDWSKFQRPFKDGDVIVHEGNIAIYKQIHKSFEEPYIDFYCGLIYKHNLFVIKNDQYQNWGKIEYAKFATEEEKQKLFDAIKANGYKWNDETKSLEELIVPKFKAGDRIKKKGLNNIYAIEIVSVGQTIYMFKGGNFQTIEFIDRDYELVSDKFDVNTLKPFDKVLVRCSNYTWHIQFFEKYDKRLNYPFVCMSNSKYKQCIPYEGNEDLLNTTNDCDDYYKTWK